MRDKIIDENKSVFTAMAEHMLSTFQSNSDDKNSMEIYEELLTVLDEDKELTPSQYALIILLSKYFAEKYKTLSVQYLRAEAEMSQLQKQLEENFTSSMLDKSQKV